MLLDYYFVGGMPEAVAAWYESGAGIHERCQLVKQIHKDLITGYQRDFGKYNGKTDAQHIEAVFMQVPRQLSSNMDDSVKRFVFKGVLPEKRRYAELRGPIDWLEKSKLVSKCYPINVRPVSPLPALTKENIFKLFFFDIGLLGFLLEMTYEEQLAQKTSYKGFIAENFVQNELRARVEYPTYSWETARSKIEFLHKCQSGEIIPVEVKSGSRTRAKSLRSFVERYSPSKTVKLIGSAGGINDSSTIVWPLYYAQFLREV
jgi:predicted AAA+ superfamily ATPase